MPKLRWYLSGVTAGAAAVLVLFVLFGRTEGGPSVLIEVDQATMQALAKMSSFSGGSLPINVRLITKSQAQLRLSGTVPLESGVGRVQLPRAARGTVLVSSTSNGLSFGGVGRIEPGINQMILGGPLTQAKFDHDQVAAICGDPELAPKLAASLPFEMQVTRLEGKGELNRSKLSEGVGAVYFDDIAVYDGERLIWSEDFEHIAIGSYSSFPMDSVYPSTKLPIQRGKVLPKGFVTGAEHYAGARSFLSISVPHQARIDGIRLRRADVTSGYSITGRHCS